LCSCHYRTFPRPHAEYLIWFFLHLPLFIPALIPPPGTRPPEDRMVSFPHFTLSARGRSCRWVSPPGFRANPAQGPAPPPLIRPFLLRFFFLSEIPGGSGGHSSVFFLHVAAQGPSLFFAFTISLAQPLHRRLFSPSRRTFFGGFPSFFPPPHPPFLQVGGGTPWSDRLSPPLPFSAWSSYFGTPTHVHQCPAAEGSRS